MIKAVNLSELSANNKRFCLSARRIFGFCYQCQSYLSCESRVDNLEYEKDMMEAKVLENKAKALMAKYETP